MRGKRNFHLLSQPEVIIIPMIDIMLFLLVFFMVNLNTLPVNLPAAQAARSETKPTVVSVTVNKAGHVFYDMDTKPTAGISERVKKTLAEKPETIFVIRGDRDTNYADITSVLDSLKAAGARHVSLAAESGKR